jgi:hypothetical protein
MTVVMAWSTPCNAVMLQSDMTVELGSRVRIASHPANDNCLMMESRSKRAYTLTIYNMYCR